MKKTIDVDIKRLGMNGEGIGYVNKVPIFVHGTLPYEKARVQIVYEKNNYFIGELETIVKPAKERVHPPCPYFDQCGGCDLQHINYEDGLFYKRLHLIQTLKKYTDASLDESKVLTYERTRLPYGYRNKAQLPIRLFKGKPQFGLFRRGSNQTLYIKSCMVHNDAINDIFQTMMKLLENGPIKAFDAQNRTGHVKGLAVRVGHQTGEIQVTILMHHKKELQKFIQTLVQKHPRIESVYVTQSRDVKLQDYFNETTALVYGKDTILATLNGYTYQLLPQSFFQLNSVVAETFYDYMIEAANLKKTDVVIDAYAGAATMSHMASKFVKKVFAIDNDPHATASARHSLDAQGIDNVKVITGDTLDVLKKMKHAIDVIFLDPPRTGLGSRLVDLLKRIKPKTIIYGSCNPATLAKDLKSFINIYEIKTVKPFDMFPQTAQIESVTILHLKP